MSLASHAESLRLPMLTALAILLIGRIRRRLKRAKDHTRVITGIWMDIQEMRRAAQLRYPHLDL